MTPDRPTSGLAAGSGGLVDPRPGPRLAGPARALTLTGAGAVTGIGLSLIVRRSLPRPGVTT